MDHHIGPLQLHMLKKKKSVFLVGIALKYVKIKAKFPLGFLIITELILLDVAFVGTNLCTWELHSPGCELGHSLDPSPVSASML